MWCKHLTENQGNKQTVWKPQENSSSWERMEISCPPKVLPWFYRKWLMKADSTADSNAKQDPWLQTSHHWRTTTIWVDQTKYPNPRTARERKCIFLCWWHRTIPFVGKDPGGGRREGISTESAKDAINVLSQSIYTRWNPFLCRELAWSYVSLPEAAANGQRERISFRERCSGFLEETLSSEWSTVQQEPQQPWSAFCCDLTKTTDLKLWWFRNFQVATGVLAKYLGTAGSV